jgi:hypothetical protein
MAYGRNAYAYLGFWRTGASPSLPAKITSGTRSGTPQPILTEMIRRLVVFPDLTILNIRYLFGRGFQRCLDPPAGVRAETAIRSSPE